MNEHQFSPSEQALNSFLDSTAAIAAKWLAWLIGPEPIKSAQDAISE